MIHKMQFRILKVQQHVPKKWISPNFPINKRRVARPSQPTPSDIDPLFISLYIDHVCGDTHAYSEFNRCISNLVVPPLNEQYKIIEILRQTNNIINISDIMGPCMNLLIKQQYEQFEELVNAHIAYNIALENMQALIKASTPIFANIVQV